MLSFEEVILEEYFDTLPEYIARFSNNFQTKLERFSIDFQKIFNKLLTISKRISEKSDVL